MPDTKISGLAAYTTLHADDLLLVVDVHDLSMAGSGTDKKMTVTQLYAGLPVLGPSGGSHAAGIAPDPGASAGSTRFLREDSTWAVPAGGGGTPGGSSGQVQWGSGGVFAGLTVGGDGTLNTATGALTITKTSGQAFAASATTDATNASNITGGTLAAARLPNPSGSTLGGVQSVTAVANNWIDSISTSGVPHLSRPAAADVSGLAASATTDTTNASNITGGSLALARIAAIAANTILANNTGSGAPPAAVTTRLQVDSHQGAIGAGVDGATITFNLALKDCWAVTLGGSRILAVSGAVAGQKGVITLIQSTGGQTVTWWSGADWGTAGAPTLSTGAGLIDHVAYYYDGTRYSMGVYGIGYGP